MGSLGTHQPSTILVVKWFNPEKGYGFGLIEYIQEDVFIHYSVMSEVGLHTLSEGDVLKCYVGPGRQGLQVTKILEHNHRPCVETAHVSSTTPGFLRKKKLSAPRFSIYPDNSELDDLEGFVKWYNPAKGFGFAEADGTSQDVFIHGALVQTLGLDTLPKGQRLRMKVTMSQRGPEARSIALLSSS